MKVFTNCLKKEIHVGPAGQGNRRPVPALTKLFGSDSDAVGGAPVYSEVQSLPQIPELKIGKSPAGGIGKGNRIQVCFSSIDFHKNAV